MDALFYVFLLFPLLGFLLTLLVPKYNERAMATMVINLSGASVLLWVTMVIFWLIGDASYVESHDVYLYRSENYNYILTFLFDQISAVYLGITTLLSFLITKYSRYYLHKDAGYKRFFATVALFELGIYIITLAGNFETLFLGWEILGISSFLLIAFYRDRYLPVRNAIKVFTYYRVADAGLLLAMWIGHHVFHHNIKFTELYDADNLALLWNSHSLELTLMALLVGMAAAVKSAQFPFSTWLARAMEGPTPSSAIYYGSIAVHIGVFLLLRTAPLWEGSLLVKAFFIVISLLTALFATYAGKTQSSVKAQIAYASIGQISIIFIEITLGLYGIALVHFAGNAFLRAYQLLISPSVVTYLIREQFFNYAPPAVYERELVNKWRNSVLIAGIKEWRIDSYMYRWVWSPFKTIGGLCLKISAPVLLGITLIAFVGSLLIFYADIEYPSFLHHGIALAFGAIGVGCAAAGLTSRGTAGSAWSYLLAGHFWIVMAADFNDDFSMGDTVFYLGGVIISAAVGYYLLKVVTNKYKLTLNNYHGLAKAHSGMANLFLLACITMAGFPLSTTFIGEDLLFTHIEAAQIPLAVVTVLLYILEGIALIRIYSRVFMGPYKSGEHYFAQRYA